MKNKVKVFKYPNGATIIYSKSSSRFTDYQIGYKIDTLSEPVGLAHLVEHIIAMDHEDELTKKTFKKQEQKGILTNAYTNASFVTLYTNVNDKHIESALKIDSGRLYNRQFDDDKIEIEKKVVVQEGRDIKAYSSYEDESEEEDDDDYGFSDDFEQALNSHLDIKNRDGDLVGNNEKVRKYNKKTILRFIDRNFKQENMVFAINTALPFEQVKDLFEKHFLSKCENSQTENKTIKDQKEKLAKESENKRNINAISNLYYQNYIPDLRTVSLEFVYPSFENTYQISAFANLDQVLFAGLNSRLMKELRGKGLVYSCSTSKTFLDKDILATSITTNTSNKNVNMVFDLIGKTIKDLVENGITDEEYRVFKNRIKSEKERSREDNLGVDSNTLLAYYDIDMIDYLNFDELKFAEKLTKEDINNYLVNLFKDNNVFINVTGNYFPNKIYTLNEIEEILGAKKSKSLIYSPAKLYIKPNNEEFYNYDYNEKHKDVLLKEASLGNIGVLSSNRINDKLTHSINKIFKNLVEDLASSTSQNDEIDEQKTASK